MYAFIFPPAEEWSLVIAREKFLPPCLGPLWNEIREMEENERQGL